MSLFKKIFSYVKRAPPPKARYNPHVFRSPFAVNKENVWKERLSIVYAFLGLNAFLVVIYACFKGKVDWADYYGIKSEEEKNVPPGRQWAKILGITQAKVYRVSGLSLVDEYEINENDEDIKKPLN